MISRPAGLLVLALVLAGCSEPEGSPDQGEDSLVTYWDEHPEVAPDAAEDGTVVLDETHTGSHVFDLPDVSGWTSLTLGVSCGDRFGGRDWTSGFGDEMVFAAQVHSGCGGSGASLGTYQLSRVGVPTRLYVMVDDDVEYSVGVWGDNPPFVGS